jgi:hypothetical protein
MAGGCNSLKMLVFVAKCQLALNVPTGLSPQLRFQPEHSPKGITYSSFQDAPREESKKK